MRHAFAPLLFLIPAHVIAAPAPAANVAAAKQGLENARATVATAMKKVEGDAPNAADLDAAHAALEALKEAIDSGAGQEPNDLDYARAALAARKELREKREAIDSRRAKMHIFNHRREIDAAYATMKTDVKVAEGKDPSSKDFEDARAAISKFKKVVEPSRQFTSQEASFASYIQKLDADVAKLENTIDEKWAIVEGSKHRAKVEEARTDFVNKSNVLSANATDQQFSDAEAAGKLLQQRLDEGKILETKDKSYGPYAQKTRTEYAILKKKADELWAKTGPARLKNEIEPAAKDLRNSLKYVRSKKATEDQLAEARTTAIVVRKLLEKFAPEAKRNEEFGAYVETVKVALVETENQLQLRALDTAQRDFRQALAKLDRKAPTDEDFQIANSSLQILTKTLEPMNAKDPMLTQPVADARAWEREGKATITRRRNEIDVAAQQAKVEDARNKAIAAVAVFPNADAGEDAVKAAEAAVKDVVAALESGKELTGRDRGYAAYDRELNKRVNEFNAKIANKKLQLHAQATRTQLTEALANAKAKIDAARAPASTDADLAAAVKSVEDVNAFLEKQAPLEQQAGSYASAAEKARMELMKRYETLGLAQGERELRKMTVDQLVPGLALAHAAAASPDLKKQKADYEKALKLFKSCKDEGAKLIGDPQVAKLPVVIDGPATLKEAVVQCSQEYDATAPLIKPLTGLISFEDGPRKAYEAAIDLHSKGKKTEALAQYDECIATGVTVGVRYPDLKDRQFTVAKTQMTLAELTRLCTAKSKELRGK